MRLRKRKSSHLVGDGFLFATLLLGLGLMNSCDEAKECVSTCRDAIEDDCGNAPECLDFVEP
jgi:hypothetical protein